MATVDEMKRALVAAHRAGDTAAAQRLAAAIQSQEGRTPKQGVISSGAQGFNAGVANVLGLPVDVANLALSGVDRVAGTQLSGDMPVGGSRWLRKAMRGFDAVPALSNVTYDRIEDLNPSDRKWAVGGEVLGGSIIPAAAPLAYARTGATAPRFLAPAVDMARQAPGRFAATEAGMALGAAQGGTIAEMVAPGSDTARFVGETAGGFLNPTQIVRGAANVGGSAADAISTNFSRAGRERAASRVLRDTLERTGEDTDTVIQALRASDPFRLDLTAGQRTGSTGLLAVERRLADMDPQFAARMEARPIEARAELQRQGEGVVRSGQPVDFMAAMRERFGQTQSNIAGRRRDAEIAALRGREAIGDVTQPDMASASVDARNTLLSARNTARGRENALWNEVPRSSTIEPVNLLEARDTIRARLLPNENLPPPVEMFTGDLARQAGQKIDTGVLDASGAAITKPGQAEATSGELLRLRNRALVKAREARAKGDFDLASQMDVIAEGALDDLGGLSDTARNFSRNLNQRFRQGFAGDVLARDTTGGPRIEPEQTLSRAFGTGGTPGDVRMRQLTEAAEFGGEGAAMLTQQDRFLRGAVQSVVDQTTGRVNPNKLAAWQRQNAAILERFPKLKSDLASAESAQRSFDRVQAITDKASRNANKTLVARIVGVENPTNEISRIVSGPDRVSQYTSLARSAANAGPEAVAGLRSSTLEGVFKNATNQAGEFDFERLAQQLLYKGPSGRDASLLELMRTTGVMDKAADERLRAIVNRATRLNNALRKPAGTNQLVDDPDALTDFLTRTIGANIGAKAGGGSGATLVAASAGSKLMRKYFQKLPANKVQEVLVEAAENPRFMAMLLEKPTTAQQAKDLTRQMNAFLYGAGITAVSDEANERRPLDQSLDAYAQ
jgi:hypothetical protein